MLKPPTEKISAETREKLLALAEFMEADQSHGFHMCNTFSGPLRHHNAIAANTPSDRPHCRTAGCIAGYCGFMVGAFRGTYDFSMVKAQEHLRLTDKQAANLFKPDAWLFSNDRLKAVRVLRNFAYTGDVDWSV